MNRRSFINSLTALSLARMAPEEKLPPVRRITNGPKFHWFGYYDKWQFDPTGRYVLGCEVDFEHRSPTPNDTIRIGMVDLRDNDRWTELGSTRAWNWQQSCMPQFPTTTSSAISRTTPRNRDTGSIICFIQPTGRGSFSCTAGGCSIIREPSPGDCEVFRLACSRPARAAAIPTSWIRTAAPRISSGAIRGTSAPGRGIRRTAASSTCSKISRARSRWSRPT